MSKKKSAPPRIPPVIVLYRLETDEPGVVRVDQPVRQARRRSALLYRNTTEYEVTLDFPPELCAAVHPQAVPPNGAPDNSSVVTFGDVERDGGYTYQLLTTHSRCPMCRTKLSDPTPLRVHWLAAAHSEVESDPVIIIIP